MKKLGCRWKKFKTLESEIIKILNSEYKSTNEIRGLLQIKASWTTVQSYLMDLFNKGKISYVKLGRCKTFYWTKDL